MVKWAKMLALLLIFTLLVSCTSSREQIEIAIDPLLLPSEQSSGLYGDLLAEVLSGTPDIDEQWESVLADWQAINADVVGLLISPELGLVDPIVGNAIDNSQWLRTNIYGEDDVRGCTFLDFRCNISNNTVNVVHGHNMNDGLGFGKFVEWQHAESCQDIPTLYLYTSDGLTRYEVFSVLIVDSTIETLPLDFMSSYEETQGLLEDLKSRSIVPDGIIHSLNALVLNICDYGDSGQERNRHCIVVASRV